MTPPIVTVVIPARDEESHIAGCIDAVAAQDHPHELLEVIVVDGASTDATARVAKEALERHRFRRTEVVVNVEATTPSNLNAGLAAATGHVVCRVDARSRIPQHYVRRCAELLAERPDVVVVGGRQVALVPRQDAVGLGIARALNNRWGMGLARYRRGATSGPGDTVYLGAFRTDDLRAAGGWDPSFPTNQDYELNRRLGAEGVVWFDASLDVGYIPRPSLGALFRQYRRFGAAKARYWRATGDRPRARQLLLLGGAPAAAAAWAALLLARPARRRSLLVAAAAGASAVEVLGASRPRAGPAGHAVGMAASAAVATGWSVGAWAELVRPGRRATPADRR